MIRVSLTLTLVSLFAVGSLVLAVDLGSHLSFAKIFVPCSNNETTFRCVKDGQCIQRRYVCDGIRHCSDNSDETACRKNKCDPKQFFACEIDNECLPLNWRCDGQADCTDGSDEKDCEESTTLLPSVCPANEFKCTGGLCIPIHWHCDGHADCPDGSDENTCKPGETHKPPCQEFSCGDDEVSCIPRRWVCDGSKDCPNGLDEEGCQPPPQEKPECKLSEGSYLCGDKTTCIGFNLLCNGNNDCPDGSDEGVHCNITCQKKKCGQGCVALPINNEETCFCNNGFKLAADNKTCYDINECNTYGTCSQKCTNTWGGHTCSCMSGYQLDNENKKTCLAADDFTTPVLYFSAKSEIKSFNMRTHHISMVSKDNKWVKEAIGVSLDGIDSRIYWTNVQPGHQSIVSAKLDGSDAKIVVKDHLKMPEDVVIDTLSRNLYYTDSGTKMIVVCSIDGRFCHNLLTTDIDQPRGLALYPAEGVMFYSDWGRRPRISKAGMDGTDQTPIITHNIKWPNGITVDTTLKRIFWSDANFDRLESAKFDGSDRRSVLEHVIRHPFSLAVFEDTLYWSDWNGKEIQSCNKFDGSQHETLIRDANGVPMGIHIFHPLLEPITDSPCYFTSHCSHICVIAKGGKKHSCKCPEQMVLNADNRTCNYTVIAGINEVDKELELVKEMEDRFKTTTSSKTSSETTTTESEVVTEENTSSPGIEVVWVENGDENVIGGESSHSRTRVSNPVAIIVGVCVGIALFILVALAVCFCYRRRRVSKDGPFRFPNPSFGLPGVMMKGGLRSEGAELKGVEVVSNRNGGDGDCKKQGAACNEESLRYSNKLEPSSGRLEFVNCSWSQPKLHAGGATPSPIVAPSSEPMRRSMTNPEMSGPRGSQNPLKDEDTDSDDGVKFDVDDDDLQSNWASDKRHLIN